MYLICSLSPVSAFTNSLAFSLSAFDGDSLIFCDQNWISSSTLWIPTNSYNYNLLITKIINNLYLTGEIQAMSQVTIEDS